VLRGEVRDSLATAIRLRRRASLASIVGPWTPSMRARSGQATIIWASYDPGIEPPPATITQVRHT
jgi:hypothetical protein